MKFAKELEHECVPEWRAKYLDYKQGKKRVKAIARAISRANGTPRSYAPAPRLFRDSPFLHASSPLSRRLSGTDDGGTHPLHGSPTDSRPQSDGSTSDQQTTPMLVPKRRGKGKPESELSLQYGSFVQTPPSMKSAQLTLPDPALSTNGDGPHSSRPSRPSVSREPSQDRNTFSGLPESAYEVGRSTPPPRSSTLGSLRGRNVGLQRYATMPVASDNSKPLLHRIFSNAGSLTRTDSKKVDFNLENLSRAKNVQRSFFEWMDKELNKIETFYKMKEDEAGERLKILRDQLHEMRNRRIEEIAEVNKVKEPRHNEYTSLDVSGSGDKKRLDPSSHDGSRVQSQLHSWLEPIERAIDTAKSSTMRPRPGVNSQALQNMIHSPESRGMQPRDPGRDYIRRPHTQDVPYRSAKRKLKLALKEYYRGLELLKSYAILNRTGFRKINKKYDKAVDAHPQLRYMTEKVNKAWFVQSDVLDGHLHAVEDLYARYFERGNHKLAIGKLRTSSGIQGEHTASAFRSGIMIGTGVVFAIQGVIYATDMEKDHPHSTVSTQTKYLLQIYGGYFLALYLFSLFCLDCAVWTRNKINYPFIFELDPRHRLDWRQLAEFPSFLILLLGLFMWVNFSRYGTEAMFLYYPVLLIFVTALLIFFPAPILFHRSRWWFAYSHWRLLLAGLYPVEFRDFFLGDMYCSLTYFTSNLELFFCLYAEHPPWGRPAQCNSNHSRLLGFFSTLPGIWRGLQCLRRYYDTRAAFPHLANCVKYGMTIMYYVTLSLYRIQNSHVLLGLFIAFAAVNAVYSSIWDLFMDWSLLQPGAKTRFLRNVRGYKQPWIYYIAMVVDVVLRFNWIFYVIYTHDVQHSSTASFFVGLSEVTRRGMWTLFRVENEHCANVARFKASRDVPLPYKLDESSTESLQHAQTETAHGQATEPSPGLSRRRSRTTASETGDTESGSVRYRAPSRTLTSIVADAHTQDFEKKRKPDAADGKNWKSLHRNESAADEDERVNSSDDDEDEQDALDNMEAAELRRSGSDRAQ